MSNQYCVYIPMLVDGGDVTVVGAPQLNHLAAFDICENHFKGHSMAWTQYGGRTENVWYSSIDDSGSRYEVHEVR